MPLPSWFWDKSAVTREQVVAAIRNHGPCTFATLKAQFGDDDGDRLKALLATMGQMGSPVEKVATTSGTVWQMVE